MIETGTLFSLLTVVLILANWRILGNIYARIMLIVQLTQLAACISTSPYYGFSERSYNTLCQVAGALYYCFWLISCFMSELMLLLVILDLRKYRSSRCHLPFRFISIIIVALSATLAFVPMRTYSNIRVSESDLYCGMNQDSLGVAEYCTYILPALLGIVLFVFMCYQVALVLRNNRARLVSQQKQALKILLVPSITVVFILVNAAFALWHISVDGAWKHVMLVLHQLVFLTPVVTHIFFANFVTKLEEFSEIRVDRCRWLLCCWRPQRTESFSDGSQLFSDDSLQRSDAY